MKEIITFEFSLPFIFKKEPKYYVACCPILDICDQGETKEEARKNLKETIELFVINCFERGVLERVLKDCGFTAVKKPYPKRPTHISSKEIDISIPFLISQEMAQCRE